MFFVATGATPDTTNWDTSSVTTFYRTFFQALAASPDVTSWDTSSATNMSQMFYALGSFDVNLSGWDFSNVTNMAEMFTSTTLPTTSYSNFLIKVEADNSNSSMSLGGGSSEYNASGETARNALISSHSWTITDGGLE